MDFQPNLAIILVLIAAFLHAFWNALIKGASDRILTMGLINLGHVLPSLFLVYFYLPPARESWVFLIASTIVHFFYYGFLLFSYRTGDLSQVYPIARGAAPVMVTIGAMVFAGENLSMLAWAGILLVSLGIVISFFDGGTKEIPGKTVAAALLAGFTIAIYTIVDGMGARLSGNAFGYIGWLFLLESIAGFGFLGYRWKVLLHVPFKQYAVGILGGIVSATAYGFAIYAKTLTKLSTVSAIRESSVIIAALIGVLWFGERPWHLRIAAACIVATGVVLLALTS